MRRLEMKGMVLGAAGVHVCVCVCVDVCLGVCAHVVCVGVCVWVLVCGSEEIGVRGRQAPYMSPLMK